MADPLRLRDDFELEPREIDPRLVPQILEGIEIKPYCRREDLPGTLPSLD